MMKSFFLRKFWRADVGISERTTEMTLHKLFDSTETCFESKNYINDVTSLKNYPTCPIGFLC
jgi:hypothetical protein